MKLGCPNDCSGHGTCKGNVCQCEKPYVGVDCAYMGDEQMCSLQGLFSTKQKQCLCFPGFTGAHCEKKQCPKNCNNRGTCGSNGQCFCIEGYTGPECEEMSCPGNDCAGHGECNRKNGKCKCEEGWTLSKDCSVPECAKPCENGVCLKGSCLCAPGWRGSSCDVKTCPHSCNSRGVCVNGACKCFDGFQGEACEEKSCPLDCSGQGKCNHKTGQCECENGFVGDGCEIQSCIIGGCSGHGVCNSDTHICECEKHYGGLGCSVSNVCMNDCHGHGTCSADLTCECVEGFSGESCSNGCKGCLGFCHDSKCYCSAGYTGENCDQKLCEDPTCGGNGFCDTTKGECVCDEGFHGKTCTKKESCPSSCSGHGRCIAVEKENSTKTEMKCFCDEGYTGKSCGALACHAGCLEEKGSVCEEGICYCLNDGSDDAMMCTHRLDLVATPEKVEAEEEIEEEEPLKCVHGVIRTENTPHDSDRSFESKSFCDCIQGYMGPSCEEVACASNCSYPAGICSDGTCLCADGFKGSTCSEEVGEMGYCGPSHTCSGHGSCDIRKRTCVCDFGYAGLACDSHVCPGTTVNRDTLEYSMCNGNGVCGRDSKCHCDQGFFGEDCSCEHECLNGGICLDGQCKCKPGFSGDVCQTTKCPGDCSHSGQCLISEETGDAFCECDENFSGEDCGVRTCPASCHNAGLCEEGVCLCYAGYIGQFCELSFDPSSEGALRTISIALEEDFSSFLDVSAQLEDSKSSRELVDESRQILRRLDADVQTLVQVADLVPARRIRGSDSKFEKMDMTSVKAAAKAATETLGETSQDLASHSTFAHAKLTKSLNTLLASVNQEKLNSCPRAPDGELSEGEICGHGRCEVDAEGVGTCACDESWSGKACHVQLCLNNCSSHGSCVRGSCECEKGFSGIDCSVKDDVTCRKACMSRCLLQCSTASEQPDRASHHSCYDECFQPCIESPGCSSESVGRHEIAHGYTVAVDNGEAL